MAVMASAEAYEQRPQHPSFCGLSYGALVAICCAVKVLPPIHLSRQEMENARNRLRDLKGQGQFELSKHLCNLAQADLAWLGTQPVLGAGSVVLQGAAIRMPMVILRPVVSHDYNSAAKSLDRELCYNTVDFKFLRSRAITDSLPKPNGQ